MLSIQADKKLNILLPNTNKVLAKVLQDANPKELETVTKGKDLKSVLNSLLKDSFLNSSADKALLSLVKNNPTLRDLRNTNQTIKDLIITLKSDKNLEPIQKQIQKLLPDIKELKQTNVKYTLENSGVFLESKLKDIKNPLLKLNSVLNQLSQQMQKSELPSSKVIQSKINNILNLSILKNKIDDTKVQLQKEPIQDIKNLTKELLSLTKNIFIQLKSANPITRPEFMKKIEKLELLLQIKEVNLDKLKLPAMLEAIKDINNTLQTSFTQNSKGFMDALTKIFNLLENIQGDTNKVKLDIQELLEKNLPQKINKIILDIKTEIKDVDSFFSKETQNLVKDLTKLNNPQKLSLNQNIKDILSNDIKAILLNAKEEVSKLAPSANQTETLKHIEKLSLSIDYHQLISHLSDSSSLYLPISWDEMQEGSISIKKINKDKFYCDIELSLKEYKKLNLRLTLYDKNQLNIRISSDSFKLKKIMGESINELRSALINSNITPRDIHFSNYTKPTKEVSYEEEENNKDLNIGFEIKI